MTPLLWEAELIGEQDLINGLLDVERSFSSFKVPLQAAGERAAQSIGENIVRNVDDFAPLAPSTLYQTAAYRLGGPLYRTGEILLKPATDTSGSVAGSAWNLTDETVTVGLDEDTPEGEIGAYLTRGNKKNNLRPRVFVRLLNSDIEFIGGLFGQYADDAVQRAFQARRH